MSAAQKVLDRLQRVRQTGEGRWLAPCPAHEDRSPSLSIRELDDGRVLLNCFASCHVGDVLTAIGLRMSDLFEKPIAHHLPPVRTELNPRELVIVLADEAFTAVLLVHSATIRPLTAVESARLLLAAARLSKAQSMLNAYR